MLKSKKFHSFQIPCKLLMAVGYTGPVKWGGGGALLWASLGCARLSGNNTYKGDNQTRTELNWIRNRAACKRTKLHKAVKISARPRGGGWGKRGPAAAAATITITTTAAAATTWRLAAAVVVALLVSLCCFCCCCCSCCATFLNIYEKLKRFSARGLRCLLPPSQDCVPFSTLQ